MNARSVFVVALAALLFFVGGFAIGQFRLQQAAGLLVVFTENAGWTISTEGGAGACAVRYFGDQDAINGEFRCEVER